MYEENKSPPQGPPAPPNYGNLVNQSLLKGDMLNILIQVYKFSYSTFRPTKSDLQVQTYIFGTTQYTFRHPYSSLQLQTYKFVFLLLKGTFCESLPKQRTYYISPYTVPKEIDFPRYNMKCSRGNVILRGIFHVVSCFQLHVRLYCGNLDYFLDNKLKRSTSWPISMILNNLKGESTFRCFVMSVQYNTFEHFQYFNLYH